MVSNLFKKNDKVIFWLNQTMNNSDILYDEIAKNEEQSLENEDIWDVFDTDDDKDDIPELFQDCGHSETVFDERGSYEICVNCGLVVQERMIDSTPEWRQGTNNSQQFSSDPIRCSIINPLLPQSSLSTTISIKGKSTASNYLLMVMNKWQSMPYVERSMFEVFSFLDEICRYAISKAIVYAAKIYYTRVYKKNIDLLKSGKKREGLRGKKRKGLIAACLFYACKQNNEPRTKQDIAHILDIPKAYVTKGCKIFLDLMKDDTNDSVTDIMNASHFIEQYGKQLELDEQTTKLALNLYSEMESLNIFFGNQPQSIAAGVLFTVLKCLYPGINEQYITNKCVITKVTITNVYRQLKPHENILLFNVFAKDLYFKLGQTNLITLHKILTTGKYLLRHSNYSMKCTHQLLAAAIVYFVLFNSNIRIDKSIFLRNVHPPKICSEKELCEVMSEIIFYKQSILNTVIKPIIFPKNMELIRPKKKRKVNIEDMENVFTFI
jgi:transcription initiation factor TFIIB